MSAALRRQVGLFGATMMGLGSIIGTGIFVSVAISAGSAGPAVILAIAVAAVVAICNGLSSAQLAAAHPVSGGTYEYGYRWLYPSLGFTAGWMFLCAKTASAATAGLGFGGYLLNAVGSKGTNGIVSFALGAVLVFTVLVLSGMRRSNRVNILIVSLSLLALTAFILVGLPTAVKNGPGNVTPFFSSSDRGPMAGFLEACAFMFVAYTGYGRIATLGEEIHSPEKNIPRAVFITLLISLMLYVGVAAVGVASVGAEQFATAGTQSAAPLELLARQFTWPGVSTLIAVGAIAAMLGVLLNLILGLSRVVLAMARRQDLPSVLVKLDRAETTPYLAVIVVGLAIAGLVLLGNVKTTWSFSAFTVLIYYAITNLAAIQMTDQERLYPRFVPWVGLLSCLFLAFWVELRIWLVGLGLIAAGLVWSHAARLLRKK